MHDLVTVGLPLVVILAGIIFNRSDVKELRTELTKQGNELRAEMQAQNTSALARHAEVVAHLQRIDADLRQFYHLSGKLEGRMDTIEKRIN